MWFLRFFLIYLKFDFAILSYLLYSIELYLFHIRVEARLIWVHIKSFTVIVGGRFFSIEINVGPYFVLTLTPVAGVYRRGRRAACVLLKVPHVVV